jgi:hypothetical protein
MINYFHELQIIFQKYIRNKWVDYRKKILKKSCVPNIAKLKWLLKLLYILLFLSLGALEIVHLLQERLLVAHSTIHSNNNTIVALIPSPNTSRCIDKRSFLVKNFYKMIKLSWWTCLCSKEKVSFFTSYRNILVRGN